MRCRRSRRLSCRMRGPPAARLRRRTGTGRQLLGLLDQEPGLSMREPSDMLLATSAQPAPDPASGSAAGSSRPAAPGAHQLRESRKRLSGDPAPALPNLQRSGHQAAATPLDAKGTVSPRTTDDGASRRSPAPPPTSTSATTTGHRKTAETGSVDVRPPIDNCNESEVETDVETEPDRRLNREA